MKKFPISLTIMMSIFASFIFSCVTAPIELILDSKIQLDSSDTQKIKDDINEELKKISFEVPAGVIGLSPDDCKNAFSKWLDAQFVLGKIPKRLITALEYAKGEPSNIHQCRTVDMEEEFNRAFKDFSQKKSDSQQDTTYLNLTSIGEQVREQKCAQVFLDPKQKRITITDIILLFQKNSLNSPIYEDQIRVYFSINSVTKEELSTPGAEEKLLSEDKIKLLAINETISARFMGPTFLTLQAENVDEAHKHLVPLTAQVIIFRRPPTKPTIISINNEEYYLLPEGEARIKMGVQIKVTGHAYKDAICPWDEYKSKIKAEDKKRKASFTPS